MLFNESKLKTSSNEVKTSSKKQLSTGDYGHSPVVDEMDVNYSLKPKKVPESAMNGFNNERSRSLIASSPQGPIRSTHV